ncbi:MAG: hypothetical protein WD733_13180 [Bryobacterales bacterium]
MSAIKTENQPVGPAGQPVGQDDPVLRMLGVGKQIWGHESGDDFVARLRSEDPSPAPFNQSPGDRGAHLAETAWLRIEKHQGEQFHTARGLPFTFELEGSGIWFFRDGKRINRKLTRSQVEIAVSRCPLKSTTEIKDLMDYAYLFGLLTDSRIRGQEW